jgi:predicted small secreted protein
MRRLAVGPALALAAMTLSACAPTAPKGVDKDQLDAAVSRAIGDPASCLLIAEQAGGRQVYRYNTHTACARALPACDGPGTRTLDQLLQATLKDGQPRMLSCNTLADASRGVGWASGVLPARHLAYAAMMEGDRAFPGRMMAERLSRAFQDAGL